MKKLTLLLALVIGIFANAQTPEIMGTAVTGEHIKILIVAEGFTSSEMTDFDDLASRSKTSLETMEPFASNLSKINFYKVSTVSNESGRSVAPGGLVNGVALTQTTKDTYWGVYSDELLMPRLLGIPTAKRQLIESTYGALDGGDMVFVIMISNNNSGSGSDALGANFWGGTGELPSFPTVGINQSTRSTSISIVTTYDYYNGFEYLVRHEFMHAFGDLDDEYYGDCKTTTGYRCGATGATGTPVTDWTYHHYDTYDTTDFLNHPNRRNIKDSYQIGYTFEGGRYLTNGKWRNSDNDIMKGTYSSATGGFSIELSSQNALFIQDRIDYETRLKPFTLSAYGNPEGDGCIVYMGNARTAYYDGEHPTKPAVGDIIYSSEVVDARINGLDKWYLTSNNYTLKISTDGVVLESIYCDNGGGVIPPLQ